MNFMENIDSNVINCVVTPLNFRLLLGVEDTDDVEKYREKKEEHGN